MSHSPEASGPAKPGTACLGCRRRKLKCSREPAGCHHCLKIDLPCVYPTPEPNGIKRKRGPYKKDKPARERHLEDLVRYLEPRAAGTGAVSGAYVANGKLSHGGRGGGGEGGGEGLNQVRLGGDRDDSSAAEGSTPATPHTLSSAPPPSHPQPTITTTTMMTFDAPHRTRSEHLVKDALIALTQSGGTASEREGRGTELRFQSSAGPTSNAPTPTGASGVNIERSPVRHYYHNHHQGRHPSGAHVFELWHLFSTRVDPVTKVLHAPSFAKKLFATGATGTALGRLEGPTATLLFSVYFAAVSTCGEAETRARFGEDRGVLLRRYGEVVEAAVADHNYALPAIESLQALLIYLIAVRRTDMGANIRALFSLGVRMAQLIGLHVDPAKDGDRFAPFDCEMRRRLWWQLCSMESRSAEEGASRSTSIMEDRCIGLPGNLFDVDLDPRAGEAPRSRNGCTDMSFVLLRLRINRLVYSLMSLRKRHCGPGGTASEITAEVAAQLQEEQWKIYYEHKAEMDTQVLDHLHLSRPYDWMCARFAHGTLLKARMLIDNPFGQSLNKNMTTEQRLRLLRPSVEIISGTTSLAMNPVLEDWNWFFRGYMQWHAFGVVVAELGHSRNVEFSEGAWAVIEPILADWEQTYDNKRDEPAWDHVNSVIQRAKKMRHHMQTAGAATLDQTRHDNGLHPNSSSSNNISINDRMASVKHATAGQCFTVEPPPLPVPAQQPMSYPEVSMTGNYPPDSHLTCGPTAFDMPVVANEASIDFLDTIDYQAFDAVFGSTSWDFPALDKFGFVGPGTGTGTGTVT